MSNLVIHLRDIDSEGLRVERELEPEFFEAALADVEATPQGASGGVNLLVTKSGARVYVNGHLRAQFQGTCGRCLGPAALKVSAPAVLTYMPEALRASAMSDEDADNELDIATYRDEQIDLSGFVRDQLHLAIPISPRCKETCRGLCQQCGVNLNEAACSCMPDAGAELDGETTNPFKKLGDRKPS